MNSNYGLGAPGLTTRNKKLLGAPGIATRGSRGFVDCSSSLPGRPGNLHRGKAANKFDMK